MTYYMCGKCNKICEVITVDQGGPEEFWGQPVHRTAMSDVSSCCKDDAHTVQTWLDEGWEWPDLPMVDLIEYGFVPEPPSAA